MRKDYLFYCSYLEGDVAKIDYNKTGAHIKELCRKKGFSVRDIQEKLCIGAFQSVYNWFSGKTVPNIDNLFALSRLLEVTMDEMIVSEAKLIIFEVLVERYDINRLVESQKQRIETYKKYLAAV